MWRIILLLLSTSVLMGQGNIFRLEKFSDISTIPAAIPTNSIVIFSYGNTPEDKLGGTFNYSGGSVLLTNTTDVLPLGTGKLIRNTPTRGVTPLQLFQLSDLATTTTIEARLALVGEGGLELTNFADLALFHQITNEVAYGLIDSGRWHRRTNNGVTNATTRVSHLVNTQWLSELVNPYEFALENDEDLGGVGVDLTATNTIYVLKDINGIPLRTNLPYNDVLGQVNLITDLYDFPTDLGTNRTVRVLGYHYPGDGGGGVFQLEAVGTTNIGTHLSSSNSTFMWSRLKNSPNHMNVRWFGAKGDNATDDQPAFQAAVDAAGANWPHADTDNVNTNWSRVYMPQGYYVLGSSVTLNKPKHMTIEGDGWATKLRTGINSQNFPMFLIVADGTAKTIMKDFQASSHGWAGSTNNCFINTDGTSLHVDAEFSDLFFQGFEVVFKGEYTGCDITECEFDIVGENCINTVFNAYTGGASDDFRSMRIVNNMFFQPNDDAIIISNTVPLIQHTNNMAMNRININGNEFNQAGNSNIVINAVRLEQVQYAIISDNIFNGRDTLNDNDISFRQDGNAIRLKNCNNIVISANTINDYQRSGIYIENGDHINIGNTTINYARMTDAASSGALYATNVTNLDINNVSINNSGANGAYLTSITNFNINLSVKGSHRSGIHITDSARGRVSGISIDNNQGEIASTGQEDGMFLALAEDIVVNGLVSLTTDVSDHQVNNLRLATTTTNITVVGGLFTPFRTAGLLDNGVDTISVGNRPVTTEDKTIQIGAERFIAYFGSPVESVLGRQAGWLLDPDSDEQIQCYIPTHLTRTWEDEVTLTVYAANTDGSNTGDNDVALEFVYENRVDGDNINVGGSIQAQRFIVPATQYELETYVFTFQPNWAQDDTIHSIRIGRDANHATDDEYTGDLWIQGIELVHD